MMTFEEFQGLTTEQKLEVSMAHLAGVLRCQTRLTDAEREKLRQAPIEQRTSRKTAAIGQREGEEDFSDGRKFSAAGLPFEKSVSAPRLVSMSAKTGRFSTVQERGAKSAARKPKPVKKA